MIGQDTVVMQAFNPWLDRLSRLFVAGWRPFTGWAMALSLFVVFMGHEVMQWYVAVECMRQAAQALSGAIDGQVLFVCKEIPEVPSMGLAALVPIFPLLGIGAMRTQEKLNDKARASLAEDSGEVIDIT